MSITPAPEQVVLPQEQELNLKDYLQIIIRRKSVFLQVFVMVLAIGVTVTLLSKPVYQTQAKLSVLMAPPQVTLQDASNPLAAIAAGLQPDSVGTTLQRLQAAPFLAKAKEVARVNPRPGVVPPQVRVEQVEGTNVIRVQVEGGDPGEIQNYANAIISEHLKETANASRANITKTLDYVTEQLELAQSRLEREEHALASFKQRNRINRRQADQEAQTRAYTELKARVSTAQSNMASIEAAMRELEAQLRREPEMLEQRTARENPAIPRLQEQISAARLRRVDLLEIYQPQHENVVAVDRQLATLEAQLRDEPPILYGKTFVPNAARNQLLNQLANMRASLYGARAESNSASAQLTAISAEMSQGNEWEVELNRLTRARELAQAAFMTLSEKRRDLEIRKEAQIETVKALEVAGKPTTPVRPRKTINIMLTAILALFLATGMALLQEFLDDRVNTPDDIERLTMLPTLGHVPLISGEDRSAKLVADLPATSQVAEAYRALRSAIGFAAIDAPLRRIQVTSASKGEGKSTTAVNLATAMAMDGKRVILVDVDLRRPNVHRLLRLESSPGISEVLVGRHAVEGVIKNTHVENLRVVTAGPIPPNPAELLGSHAFADAIESLEKLADVVVFDTPPCMPVTDPLIVASRMDGVVLVLHAGQTRKAGVKHAIELLRRARARVLGVVFNQVQARKGGYYYHYYYYYGGDGYYAEDRDNGQRRRGNRKKLGAGSQVGRGGNGSGTV
jgi:succinoglycan biosynthesis transport protein ExoP